MHFSSLLNLFTLLFALFLSGCAAGPDNSDDETYGMTVSELYQEAKRLLTSNDYVKAIEYYEKLESRFPYGTYAERICLYICEDGGRGPGYWGSKRHERPEEV